MCVLWHVFPCAWVCITAHWWRDAPGHFPICVWVDVCWGYVDVMCARACVRAHACVYVCVCVCDTDHTSEEDAVSEWNAKASYFNSFIPSDFLTRAPGLTTSKADWTISLLAPRCPPSNLETLSWFWGPAFCWDSPEHPQRYRALSLHGESWRPNYSVFNRKGVASARRSSTSAVLKWGYFGALQGVLRLLEKNKVKKRDASYENNLFTLSEVKFWKLDKWLRKKKENLYKKWKNMEEYIWMAFTSTCSGEKLAVA